MKAQRNLTVTFTTLLLIVCMAPTALSDVSSGDIIDSTNWERVQGLVPDSVVDWVKKGDWVIEVSDLNFDPGEYYADFAMEALEKNKGKYDVDTNNGIVHADTGRLPESIIGLPFPNIDPKDPKAAVKIMHNNHYMQYIVGDVRANYHLVWVGHSGFEREVACLWNQAAMDGWPGARDEEQSPPGREVRHPARSQALRHSRYGRDALALPGDGKARQHIRVHSGCPEGATNEPGEPLGRLCGVGCLRGRCQRL